MKNKFSTLLILAIISISFTGCPVMQINKEAAWQNELMTTDEAFSEMCKQQGMKNAFLEYINMDSLENRVLLRPNHPPLVRQGAIDYINQSNDTSYTLTWKPDWADVSASGDLGYTYGIYDLQTKDSLLQGTYITIWKKQEDGKWKFVLDSGNEGIGPKAQ